MTEKDYNPEQRNAKSMTKSVKTSKKTEKAVAPVKKADEVPKNVLDVAKKALVQKEGEKKVESLKVEDKIESTAEKAEVVETKEEVKPEKKKEEKKVTKPKMKKTEAIVNSYSVPISTKHSVAISKFIKYKTIEAATADLEQVVAKKKAVPMKGEIPHRKGKIMSGRFPKKAAEHFIKILQTLKANATVNELENLVISEVIANMAQRPRGSGGRVKKKRTHVKIVAKEKVKKTPKKKEAKKE